MDDTPIFEALRDEYLRPGARHRWVDEPPTTPIPQETTVGRHDDADQDGRADHAEAAEAESLRWESEQGWCEDRNPALGEITDDDEAE